MYYKLNNAYAIRPTEHSPVVSVGRSTRNWFPRDNEVDGEMLPLKSKFATNRAKAQLLRDPTALNWLIATKADASVKTRPRFAKPIIASDPEIFLQDADGLIPAFEVLDDKHTNRVFFWDGFQAEFVSADRDCLQSNVQTLQDRMLALLKHVRAKRPTADLWVQDATKINPKGVSPEHLALGCDPSLNLYGVSGDLPPNPAKLPWRFAGGHLHFGAAWLANHPNKAEAASKIVRDLDRILGVWSVGAFGFAETQKIRRRYYGLAGEFRLPPHGLEYRTLSNGWLAHPGVTQLTWELARAVFQLSPLGLLEFWYSGGDDMTQSVINNYDVETARKLLRKNERLFKYILKAANETFLLNKPEICAQRAFQVGLEGVECVVAKPLAVEANWLLKEYEAERKRYYAVYTNVAAYHASCAMQRTWVELSQREAK